MPNYDDAYRAKQNARVGALLNRIASRGDPVRAGRVIPDHGDLPIGAGRQFDATVMFLDICNSSGRGSDNREAQSRLLTSMSIFFAEMIRVVEDHGGTVEKNTGDGLMAYFSAGEAGNTTQTTALMAALTMVATAERLIDPILTHTEGGRIAFRICLDHGPITVAEVGVARGFRGIVAIGTTANIASKMLAIADADSILIGMSVVDGLPADWRHHLGEARSTGFQYSVSGNSYPCFAFTGRWTNP